MIKHLIHILTLIFAIQVSAQNPPKIKFKKIETSNFTLVFPNEITENAQKAANLLEYYFAKNSAMLKVNPQKTTLFLYNQSVESNGYASLLPKKMVWYTTSPQNSDLGSMDWFNTLALHEFRHIIQYAKNNQHFTRFAGIFYGQNAQLGLRYSIPRWYMEGDAVFAETFFSQNGRGRIPKFDMPLRTIALSDQKFSYDQAVFGSFKRYFPDHYCLGYHLVNYSMVQHGSEVWEKTYNRATKYSYWPYAFSRSLKKVSGENLQQTYKNAMLQLDSIWHAQQIQLEITNCNQINTKQKKRWTNYVDPIFVNDLVILARKSSLDEPNSFVLIDVKKGTESVLFQTDAGKFSYSATKLVWVSEMPDERWTEKSFSNIWMYDFEYKTKTKLSRKGKYFSPVLSPNGKQIAVIENNSEMKCLLEIMDSESGNTIKQIQIGENDIIQNPSWSSDGNQLVFTHLKNDGQAISVYDIANDKVLNIKPYSWETISRPVFYKDYILYNSNYSGIDNIYAIQIQSKQQFQVTSRKFGAFNPSISPDGNILLFQDYTALGYDICSQPLNPNQWKPIEEVKVKQTHYFSYIKDLKADTAIMNRSEMPNIQYEVKKYQPFKKSIEVNSWGAYVYNPYIEFYVSSQNKTGTLSLIGGYDYLPADNTGNAFFLAQVNKFYPVIEFKATYGSRIASYTFKTQFGNKDSTDLWNEKSVQLGVFLPLNFSRGIYRSTLNLGAFLQQKSVENKDYRKFNETFDGNFKIMNYQLQYSMKKREALRDLAPRLGHSISITYRNTPFKEMWDGYQFSGTHTLYLPGFIKHHSIRLVTSYEQQMTYKAELMQHFYYFNTFVIAPGGYKSIYFHEKFYKISANYAFPIVYPDQNIAKLIYIKRIKGEMFYDYAKGTNAETVTNYQSAGLQLIMDIHPLRISLPLEVGVKFSYLTQEKKTVFEFVLLGLPM